MFRPTRTYFQHLAKNPPESPEDRVIDAEAANLRLEEEAREQALAHYINKRFVRCWQPPPEVEHWPERYRQAFLDELARLEAVGSGRGKGGSSSTDDPGSPG